jgi:hypothetical protein
MLGAKRADITGFSAWLPPMAKGQPCQCANILAFSLNKTAIGCRFE